MPTPCSSHAYTCLPLTFHGHAYAHAYGHTYGHAYGHVYSHAYGHTHACYGHAHGTAHAQVHSQKIKVQLNRLHQWNTDWQPDELMLPTTPARHPAT
jgi:hypothetical protein